MQNELRDVAGSTVLTCERRDREVHSVEPDWHSTRGHVPYLKPNFSAQIEQQVNALAARTR